MLFCVPVPRRRIVRIVRLRSTPIALVARWAHVLGRRPSSSTDADWDAATAAHSELLAA